MAVAPSNVRINLIKVLRRLARYTLVNKEHLVKCVLVSDKLKFKRLVLVTIILDNLKVYTARILKNILLHL